MASSFLLQPLRRIPPSRYFRHTQRRFLFDHFLCDNVDKSTTDTRALAKPMLSYVEIITTPAADTPGTALLVHFDNKRYIFGHISEGTQRAISERNARLGKVQDIFLSGRTEWKNTGGLVGMILTLGDQHRHNAAALDKHGKTVDTGGVVVHGGAGLQHTIACTRSFVLRQQLRLKLDEILVEDAMYEDSNIEVKSLFIVPDKPDVDVSRKRSLEDMQSQKERLGVLKKTVEDMFWTEQANINNGPSPQLAAYQAAMEEGHAVAAKKPRVEMADVEMDPTCPDDPEEPVIFQRPTLIPNLPVSRPSKTAMSYVMRLHAHRGKFLPQLAKEAGVKPGKAFRTLTEGMPVTTAAGKVVRPEDVMEPPVPGAWVVIGDLPDASYIADFVAQRDWQDGTEAQERINVFFWLLGAGVSEDPRLLEFMARFPNAQHFISASDVCSNSIKFKGAAKFNVLLNKLDPAFFPSLVSSDTPEKEAPANTTAARVGLRWNLAPRPGIDDMNVVPPFDKEQAVASIGPSFLETLAEVHSTPLAAHEVFPGSDVELITLGTGSALPSRYRNVSATLVRCPTSGSILLDCGENTLGQLQRMFAPTELNTRLRDIKALYISHLHADHHLGSIAVLKAQHALVPPTQKTFVVAPARFHTFLEEYSSVEDFGRNRLVFITNESLRPPHGYPATQLLPGTQARDELYAALKLADWRTALANHCQSSFTTAVTFETGFKLAYSGDTRPTQSFVDIGEGSTILLHEATFDDELIEEAIMKRHSTISEAVEAGMDMGATKTALTHFSQRYPKTPNMEVGGNKVVYGFDHMRFEVGDIGRFSGLGKGIEKVYEDVEVVEELEAQTEAL